METKAQVYKRNYLLLLLEGAFFMGGLGFFSANTVIPIFINHMTGNKLLVGVTISVGAFLTYVGRIAIGPFVSHLKNHARYTTMVMSLTRPVTLLPGIFLLLGFQTPALIALMFAYWFLWLADGLVVPTWSEVMATTVDEHCHGRLLGSQQLIGGFLSIGAGVLINRFLAAPALDLTRAFAFVFIIGGVLMVLSCLMMALAEGAPHEPEKGRVDVAGYYKKLPRYFVEEKDNSRVLILQLIMTMGLMCLPFVILFAGEHTGLTANISATLVLVQTIGMPIGGWMWGQVCDRVSVTAGLKLAAANVLLVAALPLLVMLLAGSSPLLLSGLMVLTMLLGGISGGIWTMSFLYTVQSVRPASRPACMVLASVVGLPASFSSTLAGFIAQRFGYAPLFLVCMGLAAFSLAIAFTVRPVPVVVAERRLLEQAAEANANSAHPA